MDEAGYDHISRTLLERTGLGSVSTVIRLEGQGGADQPLLRQLTEQERAVVERVLQGHRNRDIAAELYVSLRTVEVRLTAVYRKLGVGSRGQLMALLGNTLPIGNL
ncbi:helix-turn-helix domain-containing protein [Propionibacteriaceae bacterium Y1685]